jgi:hypothetical protein
LLTMNDIDETGDDFEGNTDEEPSFDPNDLD